MLVSILWVAFVGIIAWDDVYREWSPGVQQAVDFGRGSMAAVACEQALVEHSKIEAFGRIFCMLTVANMRQQFPEYRDLPLRDVIGLSYARVALDFGWSYEETKQVAVITLLPPVALLALGLVLGWVIQGFRQPSR